MTKKVMIEADLTGYGYDRDGYNRFGYDSAGYKRNGYDSFGYDKDGYDIKGFDRDGVHKNGTRYDEDGYDKKGYDKDGYNKNGYNEKGFNSSGYNQEGFNLFGYDKDGYNRRGFKIGSDINKNGTRYDDDGYDKDGYDKDGYSRAGYKWGYDRKGYDREGYNRKGFSINGYYRDGTKYDENGYDKDGYNQEGFNSEGIHKNGSVYGDDGFSIHGINKDGINRETGELDERVELVKKYLEAGISKVAFSQKCKIKVEDFNKILKIVSHSYPTITQTQLEEVAQKSSNRYYQTLKKTAHDLENDDISIEEFTRTRFGFDEVASFFSSLEVKTTVRNKVFEYMVSGEMNMMQYFSVFGLRRSNTLVFNEAMDEYNHWLNIAKKVPEFKSFVPSLYRERKRLTKFERPYEGCRGLKIGYIDPDTKKDVIVEMTSDHEKYAKEYLRKTGEYICQSTMQSIFQQFARGTLTFDDVQMTEYRFYHIDDISASDDLSETLHEAIDDVRTKQSELSLVREEREALETMITTEKTKPLEQRERSNNRKKVVSRKSSSEDMEF